MLVGIVVPLNTRISSEWLFQNLRMKYVSKSVGRNLSDGRNTHEQFTFINPSNLAFLSKCILKVVLEKSLLYPTDPLLKINGTLVSL